MLQITESNEHYDIIQYEGCDIDGCDSDEYINLIYVFINGLKFGLNVCDGHKKEVLKNAPNNTTNL